jgi:predicted ATP-dependent serine protease
MHAVPTAKLTNGRTHRSRYTSPLESNSSASFESSPTSSTYSSSSGADRHEPVPSGLAELDELLGGGLHAGTTTLVQGQVGTGKSTLALQYATQRASWLPGQSDSSAAP